MAPNLVLKGKLSEHENSLEPNFVYKARVVAFIDEDQVKADQMIFQDQYRSSYLW